MNWDDWQYMTWNYGWDDEEPTKKIIIDTKEAEITIIKKCCSHEWLTYTGLKEVFEYCKHCNEKA